MNPPWVEWEPDEVAVFKDDDLGDPEPSTTDDLTFEELAALAADARNPDTPSAREVN